MAAVTNIRTIKRRIRSVQNTAKITKAMQMISASKMRRAQQASLAGRPYAEKMRSVLADLAAQAGEVETAHPLLRKREVNRIQIIHITPDRGLCGGLVSNLNRSAGQFISRQSGSASIVSVGRKGRDFMRRSGQEMRAVFADIGDRPSLLDVLPMARVAIDDYTEGYVDQVFVAYGLFASMAVQRPVMQQLLPVEPAEMDTGQAVGYIYEPRSTDVLEALLPRFVEMQVYHAILEALASEHSARMVAMQNATSSAYDMIDDLTLTLNKVRQESITKELLDIVGGVAALEG